MNEGTGQGAPHAKRGKAGRLCCLWLCFLWWRPVRSWGVIPRRVAAAAAAYVLCLAGWLRSVLADAKWNRYGGQLYMCDPFGSCWDVFRAHCLSVRLHSHSHSHSHPHSLSLSVSLSLCAWIGLPMFALSICRWGWDAQVTVPLADFGQALSPNFTMDFFCSCALTSSLEKEW